MALTRATKDRRLESLDEAIKAADAAQRNHAARARAAGERSERLQRERDWLAEAPVSDPLPEPDAEAES